MRKLSVSFLMLCWAAVSLGQAKMKFQETEHSFGNIQEENGPVEFRFVFTNTGNVPVIIENVKASCGCTAPGWSKEPIAPGQEGFVSARYNPRNRPGSFNKHLTVTSNTASGTNILRIKGTVIPKTKTPADEYPRQLGTLRLQSTYLNMAKVTTEKLVTKEFVVYNDSEESVTFQDVKRIPDHIYISFNPITVLPHQKGAIRVTYDAKKKSDFGYVTDRIKIYTDELENPEKDLLVVATIEEFFPPLTEAELTQYGRISLNRTEYDFGRVNDGDTLTTEFALTNSGKGRLNIRKTKANCGCTLAELEKDVLDPGETIPLKITFNTKGRIGLQTKRITIFSNDPLNPTQVLTIKAKVRE